MPACRPLLRIFLQWIYIRSREGISVTIERVWRHAMQGERRSHSESYGDDEQRRSVPARCDPSVTVIYERLLTN